MNRKDFIYLSTFAAAAISIPLLHSCNVAGSRSAMANPVFLSRLFDKETIRNVGKAYLDKMPNENDDQKLIQLLGEGSIEESSDTKAVHQYLDGRIRHEFEIGDTIIVKGWVLALTEARQCALFYLIKG